MSAELLRQVRRVEAQADKGFDGSAAERVERRRRLRLEVLRQHLASNVDFLRAAHLGGASGQQSVQAYAAFMDSFLTTVYGLAVDDARREGLQPSPLVLVALGGYGRGELHPLSDLDLMDIYDGIFVADISNPSVPVMVGTLSCVRPIDFCVYNDLVVVADEQEGLLIGQIMY